MSRDRTSITSFFPLLSRRRAACLAPSPHRPLPASSLSLRAPVQKREMSDAAAKKTDAPTASSPAAEPETAEDGDAVQPMRVVTIKVPIMGEMKFEVPPLPFEEQVRALSPRSQAKQKEKRGWIRGGRWRLAALSFSNPSFFPPSRAHLRPSPPSSTSTPRSRRSAAAPSSARFS
jgi:hypothetical protein